MARERGMQATEHASRTRPWERPRFSGIEESNILGTKRRKMSIEIERKPKRREIQTAVKLTVEISEEVSPHGSCNRGRQYPNHSQAERRQARSRLKLSNGMKAIRGNDEADGLTSLLVRLKLKKGKHNQELAPSTTRVESENQTKEETISTLPSTLSNEANNNSSSTPNLSTSSQPTPTSLSINSSRPSPELSNNIKPSPDNSIDSFHLSPLQISDKPSQPSPKPLGDDISQLSTSTSQSSLDHIPDNRLQPSCDHLSNQNQASPEGFFKRSSHLTSDYTSNDNFHPKSAPDPDPFSRNTQANPDPDPDPDPDPFPTKNSQANFDPYPLSTKSSQLSPKLSPFPRWSQPNYPFSANNSSVNDSSTNGFQKPTKTILQEGERNSEAEIENDESGDLFSSPCMSD